MTGADDGTPASRAGTGPDMGAQPSDGGPAARRPARPDLPGTRALLAAALRDGSADAEGERRAVTAFRAARDAGTHRAALGARVRRRDDWRPRVRRGARRPLRTTLSVLLASLTLGGVAYAAIGKGTAPAPPAAADRRPSPTATATGPDPAAAPGAERLPAVPSGTATAPGRPATDRDASDACRAYARAERRGTALDAEVWQRLVVEAGGEGRVADRCAPWTDPAPTPDASPERTRGSDAAGQDGEGAGNDEDGGAGPTTTPGADTRGGGDATGGDATGGDTAGGDVNGGQNGGGQDASGGTGDRAVTGDGVGKGTRAQNQGAPE